MAGVKKNYHKKCPHGKRKSRCEECEGKKDVPKKCPHGKQRCRCTACGGASFCEHNKRRSLCKDCGGSDLCEHNKHKQRCRQCGGVSICEHDRIRGFCRTCNGSQICEHNKIRHSCADCHDFACHLDDCAGKRFCSASSLNHHMRVFHSDDPKALTKRKELAVHELLRTAGVQFEYQRYVPFATCGLLGETKHAYVDFLIPRPWGHICLEVDECQHSAYDPSCDPRRDCDIFASIALGTGGKVLVLRYNPDGFKIGDVSCRVPQKVRHARLLEVLNMEPSATARWFLYYSKKAHDDELPAVADAWDPAVRALSRGI